VVFDGFTESQLQEFFVSDDSSKHIDCLGFHMIQSECSGLICADLVGAAHCLRGFNTSNKAVFVLHFPNRVGKGNSDSQGETLRDCHDNNGDGYNQESHQLFNETNVVNWKAIRVFGKSWVAFVSHNEVEYQEFAGESEEGKSGSYVADKSNFINDLVKLLLERCLVIFVILHTKSLACLARASPHSDSTD
jgi:hypothetical protein